MQNARRLFDGLKRRLLGGRDVTGHTASAAASAEAARRLAEGNVWVEKGSFVPASEAYRRAARLDPKSLAAHVNLGFALLRQGLHPQAEAALQRALALDADCLDANYLLGLSLDARGMRDEAIDFLRRAVALKPDFVACRLTLCRLLVDTRRTVEAQELIDAGIALGPPNADLHFYAGNLRLAEGAFAMALADYEHSLSIEPNHFEARVHAAKAMLGNGQVDSALARVEEALKLRPDDPTARCTLAETLRTLGRPEAAIALFRQVITQFPEHAPAHVGLGSTLRNQGQLDDAIAMFRRAAALDARSAVALSNLGLALDEGGRSGEAIEVLQQAMRVDSSEPAAFNNLGTVYQAANRLEEAADSYQVALRLDPDYADAHSNLGSVRQEQGRLDEALGHFRRAIAIKADFADAQHNLLFTANYHPDLDANEIFEHYRDYDRRHGVPLRTAAGYENERNAARRLRIGYVSPDFRAHSIRHFIEPLLAHHDRQRVEVFAYAELLKADAVTDRLRRYVDHWLPTLGMSDDELAARIRDDRIDVLIDLAGHTARNRLAVFARKPAPVSATWLGYGYTTGLNAIDYMITDAQGAPPGSEHLFSERPWRLATPGYAFRPAEGMGLAGDVPALHRGAITFATLTRAVRINHRTIRTWARLLAKVGGSRLIVNSKSFQDAGMRASLTAAFAAHGIGAERLMSGFDSPPWDVLRQVDICLDCFPHNSGTTLFEALYMGVPFVTLADRPSVGRLGSSILHGIGHPEWIARSEDEYVEIAARLASDLPALATLRAGLRSEMERSPLRDEAGFARKAEEAYRQMFAHWCDAQQ